MSFDRATFYATLRTGTLFDHGLSKRQVQGTEAILDAWDKSNFTDERWLAYMLATAYHETARAMYPVPEGGRGKGHPYGVAAANGQVYYGRGFVQITWQANYEKADKALGLDGKLVADADLALDPAVGAPILMRGMTEAWFTSFKLSDYLNDHLADYLHARRIVNGMDKAETIAGYALIFFAAITAGEAKAADHTALITASKVAQPASVVPDDIVDTLTRVLSVPAETIADTVGSVLAPADPSLGIGVSQAAAEESSSMNPLVAISIIKQIMTYAPLIEPIIAKFPDIIAKGEDAIKKFEAMDFVDGVTDIEAIVADLGMPQTSMATVMHHATASAPPAAKVA